MLKSIVVNKLIFSYIYTNFNTLSIHVRYRTFGI